MMREILFVGGPGDGKRFEVEDGMRSVYLSDDKTNGTVCYRREQLVQGDRTFDIMFYGVDGRGVIEALLSGYKGTAADR